MQNNNQIAMNMKRIRYKYNFVQDVCKTTIFYADKMVERVSREQVSLSFDDDVT